MTTFYADMAATALELLQEFGQALTLKRTTGSSGPDPVTGVVATAGASDNQVTTGLFRNYPARDIDGTRIQAGDRLAVLASTVEPLLTDRLEVDGEDWAIVDIVTSKPAATAIVYFVQVRR